MRNLPSLKPYFSRSLAAAGGRLHLASHSHHLWPDVTFEAQQQAWQDAAMLWDDKWSRIFSTIIPEAQGHIARHTNIADPTSIAFAPNTHEFILRLLSCLPQNRPPRILATDSEFHSFSRQAARLQEEGLIELETISTEPFATFPLRFAEAASPATHDLVFVSHVFFNSGYVLPDLAALIAAVPDPQTLVVIDGYHAFMALPIDLAPIQHRVFYLGGGYKYACAGEGACFLICPPNVAARPRNTGWYAAFGSLAHGTSTDVAYAATGARFMGATFDPSGLYRLNAAMRWLDSLQVTPAEIHHRAGTLQRAFIKAVDEANIPGLRGGDLVIPSASPIRGNFLAYRSPHAAEIQRKLESADIITDVRANVLRVGFGLYHDTSDTPCIASRIIQALT